MRKLLFLFAALISVQLSALQDCCSCPKWPLPFNFNIATGYRQDAFHWDIHIPSGSGSPLLKSALHWRELRIAQVYADASYTSCRNYTVKVWGDYGWIYHGRNKDLDFLYTGASCGSDKILFSESKANAGKGHVYDLAGAVGYRWTSSGGRAIFTPLIGWSHHQQYLTMYDGVQVVDLIFNNLGPFPGLHSSYKTRWYGPWIGADFDVRVECCANLFGGVEYHYNRYRGAGHWNLRTDFAGDFRHKAFGHGFIARLGTSWEICPRFTIGLLGDFRHFRTGSGSDVTPIFTDTGIVKVKNKFKMAKWHTFSIMGLIGWRF